MCPAVARDDTQLDLGQAHFRFLGGHANVASKRELHSAAQRETVDRSEDWFAGFLDSIHHRLSAERRLVSGGWGLLGELFDIRPRDKRLLSRAGDDHPPDVVVLVQSGKVPIQLIERLVVECVELLRPIDRNERDPFSCFGQQILKRHVPSRVIIETSTRLPPQVTGQDHSSQERRRGETLLPKFFIHNVSDVERRIQTHEV